jgi:hypothetical protein
MNHSSLTHANVPTTSTGNTTTLPNTQHSHRGSHTSEPRSDSHPQQHAQQPANTMPSIDELLARNRQLELEKQEAVDAAAAYQEQFNKIKSHLGKPVEFTTTTTKPVWPFTVSGPPGIERFDVVDESEAKRLYCVKHKLDPSLFLLKVQCDRTEDRNAAITKQYSDAGADTTRIPGVNLGI